jgi:Na+-translocating ferredoxin:NAD+ oxidoreductase RnfD subunit
MTTPISTQPETPPPQPSPRSRRRVLTLDNRYLAPVLITGILLAGQLSFGILESYTRTILAIVSSILMELILARLFTGKWPHLASAYITGISVGILIRSPHFWPYALCSLISITSKYAIRWRGRHLWNPSNLGVSAMLFLAPATVATLSVQWGNALWPMLVIWLLGSLIIWRLKRFHICATYVASFLALSGVRSLITGDPWLAAVAPITGPMYQLFVFFMITDPKTTVRSRWGQCVVAFAVAVAEAVLRLNRIVHAPYYALFLVGPAANAIEIWWDSRRRDAPPFAAAVREAPVEATR